MLHEYMLRMDVGVYKLRRFGNNDYYFVMSDFQLTARGVGDEGRFYRKVFDICVPFQYLPEVVTYASWIWD